MHKLIKAIGKALFSMPPPTMKKGDMFFEYPSCSVLVFIDSNSFRANESRCLYHKDVLLETWNQKGIDTYRVEKIKKLQIGDKIISNRGVIKSIENMTDVSIISPYKENWYKILPM